MHHQVIVSFAKDRQYDFKVVGGSTSEEARLWLDHEFRALGCEVLTPTGKILAVDRILSVARDAGEQRFREHGAWAEQFARNTAAILGRDLVRVDVEHYCIGY